MGLKGLKVGALCFCIVIVGIGCGGLAVEESRDSHLAQLPIAPTPQSFIDGQVSVENVSFNFDRRFIDRVEASEEAAEKLIDNETKPDGIGGRTLRFNLHYADSDQTASISVFKLSEYKEAFKLFPHYLEQRDRKLIELLGKPTEIKKWGIDEPIHVRWMDAHHDVYAKAQIVRFQGGRGLLMLTQIGQDAYNLVNNRQLQFFFQGITTDGVYFVEMSFPARMKGLPPEGVSEDYKAYNLPEDFSDPKSHELFRSYAARIAKEIHVAPDKSFEPTPIWIQSFLKSFRVIERS